MSQPLLSLVGVGCERDGRRLFHDLDLEVGNGECVALMGPNGSGKSTLLRCIAGLYIDYDGDIRKESFTYLGHRPGISLALSPLENLRWYASLAPVGRRREPESLLPALQRVGLAGYEEVLCQRLSAGQQRRVALARLMLDESRLWLLDEPLTALDADGQALLRALVQGHGNGGGAAICATHQDLGVSGARLLVLGDDR